MTDDTNPPDAGIDHQTTRMCGSCGESYEEPAGLKSGSSECPDCSGGDLSR